MFKSSFKGLVRTLPGLVRTLSPNVSTALAASLALTFLLPATAAADGRFEVTPQVGYRFIGEFDVEDQRLILNDNFELDEGEFFGLAIDIPIGRNLKLELLYNQQETELLDDGGLFGNTLPVAEMEVRHYHVGALWEFGESPTKPFVVASGGLTQLELSLPDTRDEDQPSLSVGGGVKFFLSDNFGLRLEGRAYYVFLDDRDDGRFRDQESLFQGDASFGVIFAW